MQAETLLDNIISKANEFKALDVRAVKVSELCSFTDYFVFMTGTSTVHIRSMAEAILLDLKKHGQVPVGVEGLERGEWCLLDFGDVIVNVFSQHNRGFYDLESFWKDAEPVYPLAE